MIRQIVVEIDADNILCGDCFLLFSGCPFGKPLYTDRGHHGGYMRLSECREAEDCLKEKENK